MFSAILFPCFVDAKTVPVTVGPGGDHVSSPEIVDIDVGDTVEWTWDSNPTALPQAIRVWPDGLFDSEVQNQPFTFSFTFTTPGTFPLLLYSSSALGDGWHGQRHRGHANPDPNSNTYSVSLSVSVSLSLSLSLSLCPLRLSLSLCLS